MGTIVLDQEVRCTSCNKIVTGIDSREARMCGKCRRGENKPVPAIDCRFGEAMVGDVLPLPGPMFDTEVLAKVEAVTEQYHTYQLYLHGVWIGTARAWRKSDGTAKWEECK